MNTVARHYQTGEWIRVALDGSMIAEVAPAGPGDSDEWIAPAFWDIQINGRGGVSFSDSSLTVEQVAEVVRAQVPLGTGRLCPTLISADREATAHGLRTIAAACDLYHDVSARVLGIHLEGPYLSSEDGYRGAHPIGAVRDADWEEFRDWQADSGGRIVLVTIAPERPGAIEFIRRAIADGVTVALGHTSADGPTIRAAVEAGAKLSTHLGNGIAAQLPRHPNPIWDQAAQDGLWASLIADGHHLGPSALRVLVRAKTPERIILVSDASPLAGLPPGRYGDWEVDPSGKIVVAGTPYLAGSNRGLDVGLTNLLRVAGLTLAQAVAAVTTNPAKLLGCPGPALRPRHTAGLVRFRILEEDAGPRVGVVATCVDGKWTDAN